MKHVDVGPRDRLRHEALIHGSDEEFLTVAVPFLRDGVAAGEPALVGLSRPLERLVVGALGSAAGLSLLDADSHFAHPCTAMRLNQDRFSGHADRGAERVRLLGEVPHGGGGDRWWRWSCYEAVINHAYAGLPVWALCPYDRRTTPAHVLDDVERTHPHLAGPEGAPRPSARYRDPAAFLAERCRGALDPIEDAAAAVNLVDPALHEARRAVSELARACGVDGAARDDLDDAVGEVVANAAAHGRPPVRVRAWAAPDRVVVAVRDAGDGPADPFAGILAPSDGPGGGAHGLAAVFESSDRVALSREPDGFTVRILVRTPLGRSLVEA